MRARASRKDIVRRARARAPAARSYRATERRKREGQEAPIPWGGEGVVLLAERGERGGAGEQLVEVPSAWDRRACGCLWPSTS